MTSLAHPPDNVLALLDDERAAFLAQVDRVPLTHRAERLKPEKWSVTEVIEHVTQIDFGVTRLLTTRGAEKPNATAEQLAVAQLTADKIAAVHDRSAHLEAPERLQPTGTLSHESAVAQMESARSALRAAYLAADPAALDGAIQHHAVLGPLTLRSFVESVAHHDARHAQQVAELADGWKASIK